MNQAFLKEHYDYFIYTLADLQELQTRVNAGTESSGTRFLGGTTGYAGKKFKVMNDINMNNPAWTGIGTWTGTQSTSKYFAGVFDGGGHKLTNFSTVNNTSNAYYSGLFIYINGAKIRNFEISGSYTITANTQICIIAGVLFETCHISKIVSSVSVTNVNLISLIGNLKSNQIIEDCYNFGNWTSTTYGTTAIVHAIVEAGGLINRCCNFCNISYTGSNTSGSGIVAGICASYNNNYGTITNCLNTGTLTTNRANFGCFGISMGIANISKCYNKGNVEMNATINSCGQIAGISNTGGNNYYDSTLYSGAYGVYNGVAKTTAQLTDGSNLFSDTANWVYENGYYPRVNNWLKYDSRVLTALAV